MISKERLKEIIESCGEDAELTDAVMRRAVLSRTLLPGSLLRQVVRRRSDLTEATLNDAVCQVVKNRDKATIEILRRVRGER